MNVVQPIVPMAQSVVVPVSQGTWITHDALAQQVQQMVDQRIAAIGT